MKMDSGEVIMQESTGEFMPQKHGIGLALTGSVSKGKALVLVNIDAFISILNLLDVGAGARHLFVSGQVGVEVLQEGEVGGGAIV